MWFQMVYLMPVLLPTLVIKTTSCDKSSNDDIIVKYAGHAEADFPQETRVEEYSRPVEEPGTSPSAPTEIVVKQTQPPVFRPSTTTTATTIKEYLEEQTDGVVFIPNEAPVVRVEDDEDRHGYKLHDLLVKKDVIDVMDKQYRLETEPPNDIVFIADRNKDTENQNKEKNIQRKKQHKENSEFNNMSKLDCSNLDCNNTIQTICGRKTLNGKLQFRLFLNECYFRKVNCIFKYDMSRYIQAPMKRCTNIGAHYQARPFSYSPKSADNPKEVGSLNARRTYASRRSMGMDINGQFCSHPCPLSCPDDYEPECAISATGQRKVFMNHCKLDDNSCLFAVVWHRRPLSECIGGKKADLRQNRFFIGWMQKVGIINNKGKLVLE